MKLPEQPRSHFITTYQNAKDMIKGKYVPREPKEDEKMLMVQRPQVGPYEFYEYQKGDVIRVGIPTQERIELKDIIKKMNEELTTKPVNEVNIGNKLKR